MWEPKALEKIQKGEQIHKVERLELLDAGMIRYADTPKELTLTALGSSILERALSSDANSKRY